MLHSYIADIDTFSTRLDKSEADKISIFIRGLLTELKSLIMSRRQADWLPCIQAALTAEQASIPWKTTALTQWSFSLSTLCTLKPLLEQQTQLFDAPSPDTFYALSSQDAIPLISEKPYPALPYASLFGASTVHAPMSMQFAPTSSHASTPWFSNYNVSQPLATSIGAPTSASSDDHHQQWSSMQLQISILKASHIIKTCVCI